MVISGATETLVRDQVPDEMGLIDLGEHRLRDLGQVSLGFLTACLVAGRLRDW